MSPVDVMEMVKNLEQRTLVVEQILPTLATKEDLKAFRVEMEDKFEEAKRVALVLHEDLKGDIALIAEHLADVMTRLPRRGR